MTAASDSQPRTVGICLLGFGNAVRRFCELASEREAELAERHGVQFRVTAVATARHGSLSAPEGLTPAEVLALADGPGWSFSDPVRPGVDVVRDSCADVVVEATTLTADGHPAIDHLEAAFAAGMDVVTVNKGPIAWAWRRVRDAAAEHGRQVRFEGVTMDGCPVYGLVEHCLPGVTVTGVHGVLNATTNAVLDALAEGVPLEDAVVAIQRAGFAEADPTHDVDGHDSAAKVAALANVLMDADITPDDVPRASIRTVTVDQARQVRAAGKRLRVACSARTQPDGSVRGAVELVEVGPDHPYYDVSGSSSIVVLETDLMGSIEVVERDGLLTQTAYAIYADLLTLFGRGSD